MVDTLPMFNSDTSLYAVLGDPISHSLSPLMHNIAFSHANHNGVYVAFRVKEIGKAISAIKVLDIKGAAITIPHKVSVMEFLDEIGHPAENIGAVNTIINRQGRMIGYNYDSIGAVTAIKEKTDIQNKAVAMLGAGGAARAVGYGIISEGGRLTILNRTKEKGEQLAADLGAEFRPVEDFKTVKCDILINATSLGMAPKFDCMPVKKEHLHSDMIVMDIVYNPLRTRLLKVAQDMGCTTIDGVSMFVYQGASQFELWTGKKAPIDLMRKTVIRALSGSAE
ncbi:MAG: shikimate dehydrogenase [Thermodesulfobacteriota bacterium]|nr:shikimate dehydrogenase [Thermodesulfobacteriota bacterium]